MTSFLWESPSINAFQARLDGTLDATSTTVTLDSTAGLVAPGVLLVDRQDGNGNDTATKREYMSFTGISGNDVTGVTRALASSQGQQHSSGALVESTPTVTNWGDLVDFLQTEHSATGRHVISTATIAYTETINLAVTSLASLAVVNITTRLNASGASLTGLGIGQTAVFSFVGNLSGPTSSPQLPLILPVTGNFQWLSLLAKSVASGASAIIDMNLNGTSIFDAGTRPSLPGGSTFVSTASIATKSFSKGNILTWDYDTTGGLITDFNIFLRSE